MSELSQLPTDHCPADDCRATVGAEHTRECRITICLADGTPRLPHLEDPPPGDHDCGTQTWTGYPPGAVEAAAHGLWVRPAEPTDLPFTGWLPCRPGQPGAVPDLDRVMRSGHWDAGRRAYILEEDEPCLTDL